jgi:tetratricopeptide (TPR) repeat protein
MKNLSSKILLVCLLFTATFAFAVEDYHSEAAYLAGRSSFTGKILIDQWKIEKAYELAKELVEKSPKNRNNRFLMCLALFYRGDYEEALKYIDDNMTENKGIYDIIRTTHNETKDFVRKESEHFIVSYKPGKDEILVDRTIYALEGAYKNIGGDLGYYPESKILVEIYPTVKAFTAVSTLTEKDIETSGTIALCKFNRLMITSPRVLLRGYRWMRTLSHEYVHYLIYQLSRGKAPIWLHEGIAKYLEDRFDSDTLGAMSPSSENVLSRRLKNDSLITLTEMHPSMAKLKSSEDVQVAFAEVNSMIGYMVKKKGFESVKKVLELMGEGKSDVQAIEEIYLVSLEGFYNEWKDYALKSGLKEIPGMEVTGMGVKLKSNEDLSEEAIENEELLHHGSKELKDSVTLGNLLRDRGRYKAASFEYKKAYDEDPFSIISLTKLSHSYMLLEDADNALKVLNEAKALYPDYVTTYYRLGIVYMMKEEYEKSLEYFDTSIRINPFIPDVRESLVYIYDLLKDEERSKKQQGILDKLTKGH